MTDEICSARMAAAGAMAYSKLVEENAFTPFAEAVNRKKTDHPLPLSNGFLSAPWNPGFPQ